MAERYKIVFLINDNNKWQSLFGHIENLFKQSTKIESIAVVITNTAILSCLKDSTLTDFKLALKELTNKKVWFWLCGNTVKKFHISEHQLLPEIIIAEEGGILKAVGFQSQGYYLITE